MDIYVRMLISVILSYLATYSARETDLKSIEEPPLLAYVLLMFSAVLLFPVYTGTPALAVVNALSVGVFSTVVNFVFIIYRAPVIGAYDLVFLYLEGFALPPIPVGCLYVPSMLIHTSVSIGVALYRLKVKNEDFVRFFEVHEAVARYLFFAYGMIITLLLFSSGALTL